jgi:hypothetical protein
MPIAPFEPAEVTVVDRQDDAVVFAFRSALGGEFPMKFQRSQFADFAAQFEKEVAPQGAQTAAHYHPIKTVGLLSGKLESVPMAHGT